MLRVPYGPTLPKLAGSQTRSQSETNIDPPIPLFVDRGPNSSLNSLI